MKTVNLKSSNRMSNRQYHAAGKPTWWARIGSGQGATFVQIGRVRGDEKLDVTVEVPDDCTEIHIGCGPNNKHGIRQTVEVQ